MKKRMFKLICVLLAVTFLTIENFQKTKASIPAPSSLWDWPVGVDCSFIFNGVEVYGRKVDCMAYPVLFFCWPTNCIATIEGDPIGG